MQNMIFGEKIPFDTILDGIAKLEKEMNSLSYCRFLSGGINFIVPTFAFSYCAQGQR